MEKKKKKKKMNLKLLHYHHSHWKELEKTLKMLFYFFSTMKNEEVMTFLMGGIK